MHLHISNPILARTEAVCSLGGSVIGFSLALTFQSIRQGAWLILISRFSSSADILWLYNIRMRKWIIWAFMWFLVLSCFWNPYYSQHSALSRTKMHSHGETEEPTENAMGCSPDMLLRNNLTDLCLIWLCGSHPAYGPQLRFPDSVERT